MSEGDIYSFLSVLCQAGRAIGKFITLSVNCQQGWICQKARLIRSSRTNPDFIRLRKELIL